VFSFSPIFSTLQLRRRPMKSGPKGEAGDRLSMECGDKSPLLI